MSICFYLILVLAISVFEYVYMHQCVSTPTFFRIVMIHCFEQSIHKLCWKGLIKRVILFIIATNL